jgi:solute carrier family 35, member E3
MMKNNISKEEIFNGFIFVIKHIFNIISSVILIEINKYLYINYDYPCLTLTCLNLLFTLFVCLLITCGGGSSSISSISLNQIPLTCLFIGSILVSNYSLKFNNQITVYQALKLISILFLFIYLYNNNKKKKKKEDYSILIIISILLLLISSICCLLINNEIIINLFELNAITIGLTGSFLTSIFIIAKFQLQQQQQQQQKYDYILINELMIGSIILILFKFLFEPTLNIIDKTNILWRTNHELLFLILSCLFAFSTHLSTSYNRCESFLTYNIISYFKLPIVIILDSIFYGYQLKIIHLCIILLIITGVSVYSCFVIEDQNTTNNNNNNNNTNTNKKFII